MNPQANEGGEGEKLSESKPHSQPVVPQESDNLLNQAEYGHEQLNQPEEILEQKDDERMVVETAMTEQKAEELHPELNSDANQELENELKEQHQVPQPGTEEVLETSEVKEGLYSEGAATEDGGQAEPLSDSKR